MSRFGRLEGLDFKSHLGQDHVLGVLAIRLGCGGNVLFTELTAARRLIPVGPVFIVPAGFSHSCAVRLAGTSGRGRCCHSIFKEGSFGNLVLYGVRLKQIVPL